MSPERHESQQGKLPLSHSQSSANGDAGDALHVEQTERQVFAAWSFMY